MFENIGGKSMRVLWELGVINQKKQKKDYHFFTLAVFASTMIILLFFTLQRGGYNIIQNELRRNIWVNDVSIYFESAEKNYSSGERSFRLSYGDIEKIVQDYEVKSVVIEHRTKDTNFRMFLDQIEVETPLEWISGINVNFDTFSYTKIQYGKRTDVDFIPIIYGRSFITGDREVAIIDENSARMLNVNTIEQILGQEIVFQREDGEEVSTTIIGIYAAELGPAGQQWSDITLHYGLSGLRSIHSESILVSSDIINFLYKNRESTVSSIVFSVKDFGVALELYEILSNRFGYKISSEAEFITTTFVNISLFLGVFGLIGIILLLLSFLNLYTIALLNAQKRKKWFVLQNILGFRIREIWMSYTFETLITLFKGFFLALLTNFAIILLLNLMVEYFFDFVPYGLMFFESFFIVALLLFSVVLVYVIIIGLVFNIKLKKINIIQELV